MTTPSNIKLSSKKKQFITYDNLNKVNNNNKYDLLKSKDNNLITHVDSFLINKNLKIKPITRNICLDNILNNKNEILHLTKVILNEKKFPNKNIEDSFYNYALSLISYIEYNKIHVPCSSYDSSSNTITSDDIFTIIPNEKTSLDNFIIKTDHFVNK
tara:strand:+ start:835 stop:1305 length:471 start_codon:yes stop_codon:yes gene_type:complete